MSHRIAVLALVVSSLLLSTPALARTTAGGDTSSTVTLFANFSADVVGSAPNLALPAAPAGDFLTLNEASGTVEVNAVIDGLTMAALLKQQSGTGGVSLTAWPAPAPPNTEKVTLGWRSVSQDDNPSTIVACVVRSSTGSVIASVNYGPHGSLVWNGSAGDGQALPVTYRQNRNNQFTIAVDLAAQRVSLSIDGVAIAGFQAVPFASPATDVARLSFDALGTSPQVFAVDDLFAVALARTPDQPPSVSAPTSTVVEELGSLTFTVTATDPDADPIAALSADLSALPSGHTATFTASADGSSGTFSWSPALGQAGTYDVIFTVTANGASSTAATKVYVAALGTSVVGHFIWTPRPGDEGNWMVTFIATDAGGTTSVDVPLTVLPSGAILAPVAPATSFTREPGLAPQAPMKGPVVRVDGSTTTTTGGTMELTATSTSDGGLLARRMIVARAPASAERAALITLTADFSGLPAVNDAVFTLDNDPIVTAPANVTAEAGTVVTIHIGADDLDADAIATLTADLSGLPAGNNAVFTTNASNSLGTLTWTPTAGDLGDWTVTFQATNRLVGSASTVIHVSGPAQASIFSIGGKRLNLASGKPFYCIQIEPIASSFSLEDVDLSSIVMISEGTGSVDTIPVSASKQATIGDRDSDLIPDLTVCCTKADVRRLFSALRGTVTVTVAVEGRLMTGGHFSGTLTIDVNAGGGKLAAAVSPNPLNPQATLRFVTTQAGDVRVRLFNAAGRLVRELLPTSYLGVGEHQVAIRAEDASGRRLASGVYFYRVEAREGESIGRIAVVK